MNVGQAAQMNQVGGSGVGVAAAEGMPEHQPMQDVVGLSGIDAQFVMLRNSVREKIFDYIGRKQSAADWRRRLPELARRLEEILFTKFSNKNDYYNMTKGPVQPQLMFAIKTLSAQNQQHLQISPSSGYGTMIPTHSVTQGSSGNSRLHFATDNCALPASGAGTVAQNANISTSMQGFNCSAKTSNLCGGSEYLNMTERDIQNRHDKMFFGPDADTMACQTKSILGDLFKLHHQAMKKAKTIIWDIIEVLDKIPPDIVLPVTPSVAVAPQINEQEEAIVSASAPPISTTKESHKRLTEIDGMPQPDCQCDKQNKRRKCGRCGLYDKGHETAMCEGSQNQQAKRLRCEPKESGNEG